MCLLIEGYQNCTYIHSIDDYIYMIITDLDTDYMSNLGKKVFLKIFHALCIKF